MKSTIDGLCTPSAKKFVNISAFNPFNDPVVISTMNLILRMRKLRPRELKRFTQGHIYLLWQSQMELNSDSKTACS